MNEVVEARILSSWQFKLGLLLFMGTFLSANVQMLTGNFFLKWTWQYYWLFGDVLAISIGCLLFLWSIIHVVGE